jgi:hypothetical protein
MPQFETIKASEAPPPPKKLSKDASDILDAINGLKRNEVLRLQPDPDRSMRGLKMSVSRVASRHGLKIESWDDPTQDYLYVRKTR